QKLGHSLASIWVNERLRRKVVKRRARQEARRALGEPSVSPSQASDVSLTPLTPPPSPPRMPPLPAKPDPAYAAHIERVTAVEKKRNKGKALPESSVPDVHMDAPPSPPPATPPAAPPSSNSSANPLDALLREMDALSDSSSEGDKLHPDLEA